MIQRLAREFVWIGVSMLAALVAIYVMVFKRDGPEAAGYVLALPIAYFGSVVGGLCIYAVASVVRVTVSALRRRRV